MQLTLLLCSYIIESGCCFLTLVEKKYPAALAFGFLDALQREFLQFFGVDELKRVARPFGCNRFDPQLSKLRKQYLDPNSSFSMQQMNTNLQQVRSIMEKSISDVVQRGEKLESLEQRGQTLRDETKKFHMNAKKANFRAMLQRSAPMIAVALILLFVIYWKLF